MTRDTARDIHKQHWTERARFVPLPPEEQPSEGPPMPSELYQRAATFAMDDQDCEQIMGDLRAGLMLSASGASTLMLGAAENNARLDRDAPRCSAATRPKPTTP